MAEFGSLNVIRQLVMEVLLGSFQAAVLLPVNVCWQTGAMFGGIWSSASP
jgi:hypothetical protein